MANIKEIKDRINSIQETRKITNAMYLISSTKLKKARAALDQNEPYFFRMQGMIDRIQRHLPNITSPYFQKYEKVAEDDRVHAFLVITADKGLAGAYNHNVLKMTEEELKKYKKTKLFVVGELGRQYFENRHIPISDQFLYTAQDPSLHRSRMISLELTNQFLKGEIHEVSIVYTLMVNNMTIQPQMEKLLPFQSKKPDVEIPLDIEREVWHLQPTPEAVIDAIVPSCVNGYIYSALVESFCSEQNARMMAMQAANKSANSILHDLGIEYNRVRQALITQELTEVCSGAKAQKKQ